MGRHYVHLSADEKTAKLVGSRHTGKVVILQVQARAAYGAGIAFYQEHNGVWLSDAVPGVYLVGG
jgi:putative RNA 2'-phosphotransferase